MKTNTGPGATTVVTVGDVPAVVWSPAEHAEHERQVRATGLDGVVLSGNYLRDLRRRYGVKRAALGEALGYSPSTIWDWEYGRHEIPGSLYEPILRYFKTVRAQQNDVAETLRDLRFG